MGEVNANGLNRYIPVSVRKKIRKAAGFGCVVCGTAICQFDHVSPGFSEAYSHNPSRMTLLCGYCHDKKTRGILSVEFIQQAMKDPKSLQKGFISDFFDFGTVIPIVSLGKQKFVNTNYLIQIDGQHLLYISQKSENGVTGNFLNARFHDTQNREIFRIEENVWFSSTDNWDINFSGTVLEIRDQEGSVALKIENKPREEFIVHEVKMNYNGYQIQGDEERFSIQTPEGKEIIALSDEVLASGFAALKISKGTLILRNMSFHKGEIDLRNAGAEYCYFGKETKIIMG